MSKLKKSRMVKASALSDGRRAAARAASLTPLSWACGRIERTGNPSSLIFVRDIDGIISREILPERLPNARVISGNLELRFLLREEHPGRFVIIDQSENETYVPDLTNRPNVTKITVDIPLFLRDTTGIKSWPGTVSEFPYREIIKRHWPKFLQAYQDHIERDSDTLSEERLRAIAAEAVLGICLTDLSAPADLLELAVRKGTAWDALLNFFGRDETSNIREMLKRFPPPWGDMFDTIKGDSALKAVVGLLILGQHYQNPGEILALIDPRMHAYRNADGWSWPKEKPFPSWLKVRVQEFEADIGEGFEELSSRLDLSNSERTKEVLSQEQCSQTIRTLGLMAALGDILEGEKLSEKRTKHQDLAEGLRDGSLSSPVDDEEFNRLKDAFLHVFDVYGLLSNFAATVKSTKLKNTDQLKFSDFSSAFIDKRAHQIEYLTSSLRKEWSTIPQLKNSPTWVPQLREKIGISLAQLERYALGQLDAFNAGFQRFIQRRYGQIAGSEVPTTTEFIQQFIKGALRNRKDEEPIFVILFDGMRFDLWRLLFSPLFADRYVIQREEVGLARLPTTTKYSRRAAFAWLPPSGFNIRAPESALLLEALKRIGSPGKMEDATAFQNIAGVTMAVKATDLNITWLVLDCSDKLPHVVNYDLATTFDVIKGLSDSVRAILNTIPENAHVFVLSDHGFSRCGTKSMSLPGDQVSYRYAFLDQEPPSDIRSRCLCFKASEIDAGDSGYFLFPYVDSHFIQRGRKDRTPTYHHGGVTLEELLVPFVHLIPARAAKPTIEIVVVTEDEYKVGVKGIILVELILAGSASEQVTLRSDVPGFKDRILNLISRQAKTVEISFMPDSEGDFPFIFEARKGRSVLGKSLKTITVLPKEGVERTGVDKLKQLFGED